MKPFGIDYTMDKDLADHCPRLHCKPVKRLHNISADMCTSFLFFLNVRFPKICTRGS